MPPLADRIRAEQAAALDAIANARRGGGGQSPLAWYLNLLDADQMAVLTITWVLSHGTGVGNGMTATDRATSGTPLLIASTRIAETLKMQAEFGQWVSDSRTNQKEAAVRGVIYRNLYEALRRSAKRINKRAVQTWWRRIGVMRDAPWPREHCIQLGSALLVWLHETCPAWFDLVLVPQPGGKTLRVIRTTPAARLRMRDISERTEAAQVFHMPMLVPPNPWRWEERQPQEMENADAA